MAATRRKAHLPGEEGVELRGNALAERVLVLVVHPLVQGGQLIVLYDLLLHFAAGWLAGCSECGKERNLDFDIDDLRAFSPLLFRTAGFCVR